MGAPLKRVHKFLINAPINIPRYESNYSRSGNELTDRLISFYNQEQSNLSPRPHPSSSKLECLGVRIRMELGGVRFNNGPCLICADETYAAYFNTYQNKNNVQGALRIC